MNIIVISHKETWPDPTSPCGYSTVGGFPFQMQAISNLFGQTTLMLPIRSTPLPVGAIPLTGHNLRVIPLAEPTGLGWRRKLSMIPWIARHVALLWREIAHADSVHTPVGSDIGTIGLFIALLQRKPLFIRHCGTWGKPASWLDRVLQRFLEFIAGGRIVVLATGGADTPPSRRNPNIDWIFSTTLTQAELERTPTVRSWLPETPLRLITVGRLSQAKNVDAILRALPEICQSLPDTHLDILGEGEYRPILEEIAAQLGLADLVTFHGNVSHEEVMNTLLQAHLFVFPTLREGFPKAVLEALACGLPVMAGRISVIPQLLRNGCGMLMNSTSASDVARAVTSITSDPAQLAQMGTLARQSAQGYTLEAWGETIGTKLRLAWGPLK